MEFLQIYNLPANTILYKFHGENTQEWKLTKSFGELRIYLQKGFSKPVTVWIDQYDFEEQEFIESLRLGH